MYETPGDIPVVDAPDVTPPQEEPLAAQSLASHIVISRATMIAILAERIPHFTPREGLTDEQLYQWYLGTINGEY